MSRVFGDDHYTLMPRVWQRTLKKLRTLKKKFQSALNLGPNQRTLKNVKSVLRVYINITFDVNF